MMRRVKSRWVWVAIPVSLTILLVALIYRPSLLIPLPSPQAIRARSLAPSSFILDRNGRVLYEIIDPDAGPHRPLELVQVPLALRQAVIATEDASFYRNPGVDLRAIARALWLNLRSGQIVSGGSTITQQVARNLLLAPDRRIERSWARKLHEALLAYHLTRVLSKDEILALYLNETYFGRMAYGVEAAARAYFDKPAAQLDLAECALLAGLPQAPAAYDPFVDLEAAQARQRTVLGLMDRAGFIDAAQAERAAAEPWQLRGARFTIQAPHACLLVRDEASRLLGQERVRGGGLRIYTTLDLGLQRQAEAHVARHLEALNQPQDGLPGHNVRNAAAVALDPTTGAVRTLVGSPDYFDARIDGALNAAYALRQPGSALKPLTYAAAFERGYGPATVMLDVRSAFTTREGTPYVPQNYDRVFHGPVSLREALACSYNVIAVKLLDRIGVDALPDMAQRVGIESLSDQERQGLALTLGSAEVRLIDLTAAYGALANGGRRVEPYLLERIEDASGRVLYAHKGTELVTAPNVLDERIAYLITDILDDEKARAPAFGQGGALELPFPAAVKTGTTSDWRDNWTVGYSTAWATGVWVGNADNEPMERISGVDGAAPIWQAIMQSAHQAPLGPPPQSFRRPPGLVGVEVCTESGQLPTAACLHRKEELFLAEHQPTELCTLHHLVAVDAQTGELADESCPPERRIWQRVTLWPSEALPWAEERGLVRPLERQLLAVSIVASGKQREAQADLPGSTAVVPDPVSRSGLRIVSPDPNSAFLLTLELPDEAQQIEVVVVGQAAARGGAMTLWVDGVRWHVWDGPPYDVLWPLAPGEHEFVARSSLLSSDPVQITVVQPEGAQARQGAP